MLSSSLNMPDILQYRSNVVARFDCNERTSAMAEGCPTGLMRHYYSAFAEGGFGLALSEGIYADKMLSQGYPHQPGLSDGQQRKAWRAVVDDVHAGNARMVAQLMHAGALSQRNPYREGMRGTSPLRPKGMQMTYYRGVGECPVPQAMSEAEIVWAMVGFAEAAAYAREVGFEGIEIYDANSYPLDQFLTERMNSRDDRYGDSVSAVCDSLSKSCRQ